MTDEHKSFDMYKALGYLNYLQCGVKPEISCALKRLSRYATHYGDAHIKLAKHLMRWCKRSKKTPLVLKACKDPKYRYLRMQVMPVAQTHVDPSQAWW